LKAQRLNRVWDGLLDAIRQMQLSADELRRLSGHNHVPEYVEYLHKNSLVNAMSVVTEIAQGLDTVRRDLEQVLIGPQPLLEDYEDLGLYDDFKSDGDVHCDCNEQCGSDEDNSLDSDEINDSRLSHMNERI
jgi:hypothetical protein